MAWIDHELALGLGLHLQDANKLATMAIQAQKQDAIQQSAVAAWMALARTAPQEASAVFGADPARHALTADFAMAVSQRLNALGNKIIARLPQPKDLLSAP